MLPSVTYTYILVLYFICDQFLDLLFLNKHDLLRFVTLSSIFNSSFCRDNFHEIMYFKYFVL